MIGLLHATERASARTARPGPSAIERTGVPRHGITSSGSLFIALAALPLATGLALAYLSSHSAYFALDISLTRRFQSLELPGLGNGLAVISEVTNFYPGAGIWLAAVLALLWRGLRIEALTLALALVPFLAGEALGALVDRSRPDPGLVRVAQVLVGNGFPSGHVLGATVFYGTLAAFAARGPWPALLKALTALAALLIVAGAGLARIYRGAHWPSDVTGGLALGGAALAALIWIYIRMKAGRIGVFGVDFVVEQR